MQQAKLSFWDNYNLLLRFLRESLARACAGFCFLDQNKQNEQTFFAFFFWIKWKNRSACSKLFLLGIYIFKNPVSNTPFLYWDSGKFSMHYFVLVEERPVPVLWRHGESTTILPRVWLLLTFVSI